MIFSENRKPTFRDHARYRRRPLGLTSATQILPPPRAIPGGSWSLKSVVETDGRRLRTHSAGMTLNLEQTLHIRQAVAAKSESNAKSCVPPVNSGENPASDKPSIGPVLEIRQADLSSRRRKFEDTGNSGDSGDGPVLMTRSAATNNGIRKPPRVPVRHPQRTDSRRQVRCLGDATRVTRSLPRRTAETAPVSPAE